MAGEIWHCPDFEGSIETLEETVAELRGQFQSAIKAAVTEAAEVGSLWICPRDLTASFLHDDWEGMEDVVKSEPLIELIEKSLSLHLVPGETVESAKFEPYLDKEFLDEVGVSAETYIAESRNCDKLRRCLLILREP